MATKTLILRPISVDGYLGNNESGGTTEITPTPSDTPSSQYHTLVSEEVADDDATMVTASLSTNALFDFSSISGLSVVAIRGCARVKSSDATKFYPAIQLIERPTSTGSTVLVNSPDYSSTSFSEWGLISVETSDTEIITSCLTSENFALRVGGSKTSTAEQKDTVLIYVTQMYLEIDYDDGTTEATPIRIKQNGAWESMAGTIYRKENGVWSVADTTLLTDKYIVQNL